MQFRFPGLVALKGVIAEFSETRSSLFEAMLGSEEERPDDVEYEQEFELALRPPPEIRENFFFMVLWAFLYLWQFHRPRVLTSCVFLAVPLIGTLYVAVLRPLASLAFSAVR